MRREPEFTIESAAPKITLEQVFDAPRRQVFEAWTKTDQVKCWYSPPGFVLCDCDMDVRVNGKWRVVLCGPHGEKHGVSGEYREIDAPQRVVQTFRYDGAPQVEAAETLNFVEKDGKTILTSTIVHTSPANLDWHVKSGVREGATALLERLSDHLEAQDGASTDSGRSLHAEDIAVRKTRRNRRIALACVVVALAGGGLYWALHNNFSTPYVKATVDRGPVIRAVDARGVIEPVGVARIRAKAPGKVAALYCNVGAEVKAGEICAKLDPEPYQSIIDREKAALAEALAQLKKDKALVARAKQDVERSQISAKRRTNDGGALNKSRIAYEEAQARLASDEATAALARDAIRAAEARLADGDISSPIGGTIVSRNVEPGQEVGPGADDKELFFVAPDPAVVQLRTAAKGEDIGEIKIGDQASFTIEGSPERVHTGEIARIDRPAAADRDAARDNVVIDTPNPDRSLAFGMKATVRIVVERRDDVVRAPNRSLDYASGGGGGASKGEAQLWLLRNGSRTTVKVRIGLRGDAYTEVVEGVTPGDTLVIADDGGRLAHVRN